MLNTSYCTVTFSYEYKCDGNSIMVILILFLVLMFNQINLISRSDEDNLHLEKKKSNKKSVFVSKNNSLENL